METTGVTPSRDACDTKLSNVNPVVGIARRERFLAAYRLDPVGARAARRARVHRGSVYRWMRDPAFVAAMGAAAGAFFDAHRAKVLAAEAERRRCRAERERARRPMRCYHLARARAAKRRKICRRSGSA